MDPGAVSRYKFDQTYKIVKVQNLNCEQLSVSGCNGHYKFVFGAGAKAKTVISNLPLLSVLVVSGSLFCQESKSIYLCFNLFNYVFVLNFFFLSDFC